MRQNGRERIVRCPSQLVSWQLWHLFQMSFKTIKTTSNRVLQNFEAKNRWHIHVRISQKRRTRNKKETPGCPSSFGIMFIFSRKKKQEINTGILVHTRGLNPWDMTDHKEQRDHWIRISSPYPKEKRIKRAQSRVIHMRRHLHLGMGLCLSFQRSNASLVAKNPTTRESPNRTRRTSASGKQSTILENS